MRSSTRKKTRIAPTPSGFLHLGNAFNFIYTAVIAHFEEADILLRIDDLDQARYRREYADDIFQSLNILEIEYHQGPRDSKMLEGEWSQRFRLPKYHEAIAKLRASGLLYACECSRKEIIMHAASGIYPGTCRNRGLSLDQSGVTWRLHTEQRVKIDMISWPDKQAQTKLLPQDMHDMVIRRKDGIPSYQLSSLVDDMIYGIDLIVRGEDLYSSSLAQLYLARELALPDFSLVSFYHHPLLHSAKGDKISKSVLQQPGRLIQDYSTEELYQAYSRFIGLKEECHSLSNLLEIIVLEDLLTHSSSSELGS